MRQFNADVEAAPRNVVPADVHDDERTCDREILIYSTRRQAAATKYLLRKVFRIETSGRLKETRQRRNRSGFRSA
jgi:hypothetical protein